MARGAIIYRARLELSHLDRDVYADRRLSIARHPSETVERMLARLLAFALRYEEDLEFGRGVSSTDEPDLWSRAGDGRVRQWIEVGQPDGRRLLRAARNAESVSVFAFGPGLERWRAAQIEPLGKPENLSVARLDDTLLATLSETTDRQLRWSVTVSDGVVYLSGDEQTLETAPEVWLGAPLG